MRTSSLANDGNDLSHPQAVQVKKDYTVIRETLRYGRSVFIVAILI